VESRWWRIASWRIFLRTSLGWSDHNLKKDLNAVFWKYFIQLTTCVSYYPYMFNSSWQLNHQSQLIEQPIMATSLDVFLCYTIIHCNGNSEYILLFWELRGLSPNFHIHVSVSDLYVPRIGPHISSSRKGRPIVGIYINRSLTHECRNWDWDPDIPFLGIFVSNFRHFVFAVYGVLNFCVTSLAY
jgi:hypothetical protein